MGVRVIAIGQAAAGDDGVGPAVLARLRERGVPAGTELLEAAEATALMPMLETRDPVVIVDAVVSVGEPGEIVDVTVERLAPQGFVPLSTHGIGVVEAIELARTLSPDAVSPSIRVVGVTIGPPRRFTIGLSPAVARAVSGAADAVWAYLGG